MPDLVSTSAPAPAHSRTAPEDRVPTSQKVAYALGNCHDMWGHWLYSTFAYQVFNIYLGLDPAYVSTAIMINLIFNGIADPLFGWFSDNTRTRFGRRRPFILVGGVLAGLALPILVSPQPGWGNTFVGIGSLGWELPTYFLYMIGSSALFIPLMSCFFMAYQSLGSELTPDYHERTLVMSYKEGLKKIPELAMFVAAQFTTMAVWVGASHSNLGQKIGELFSSGAAWRPAAEGTKPNILIGAQFFCVVLGLIMVVCSVIMFFVLRERYYNNVVERKQARVSLKETLWQTLQCRPFRIQLSMKVVYAMCTSMVGALGYYVTVYYVCHGDLGTAGRWNTLMGISGMVFGFLGVPTFAAIARRQGKRHALVIVLSAAILVFIGTWWFYSPSTPWIQIFASGLIAFTSAGFWMMDGSITADIIDYDELQTGKRREGAFWSCTSWIMRAGQAIGNGASGWILSSTGFNSTLGGNQTEHALFMMRVFLMGIPLVGLVLALIVLSRYPLSQEKMAEIRQQLEARRGKV